MISEDMKQGCDSGFLAYLSKQYLNEAAASGAVPAWGTGRRWSPK